MSELPCEYNSILDAVRHHAEHNHAASLCFGSDEPVLSYRELWQQIERKLVHLRALGVKPGDRVAMSMSNTGATVISLLALMQAGATLLPLYHRPAMPVDGKDYARIVSVLRASRAPWLLTHAADVARHQQAVSAAGTQTEVAALEELPDERPDDGFGAQSAWSERVLGTGPAVIQFSAGSTAEPKGLCLHHEQLVYNAHGLASGLAWTARDVVCSWLPLFHDMGLVAIVLTTLYVGSSLRMRAPRQFVLNPLGWLRLMSEERATLSMAPQFAYNLVLEKALVHPPEPGSLDLSSLRMLLNGAEQVDPAACDRFEAYFAKHGLHANVVQPGYGLAENCVAVAVRSSGSTRVVQHFDRGALSRGRLESRAHPSSDTVSRAANGRAVLGTELFVLDEDDRKLPAGSVGELAISGASTARTTLLADGELRELPRLLRTGDIGAIYEDELYILGRAKEMVKRAGEAFSPADIEHCIGRCVDQLGLVGAFGYYDEQSGSDELVVVAESRQSHLPERCSELATSVRAAVLKEFRAPLQDVLIVRSGAIPRTTSGKIRRLALRDSYLLERRTG